MQNLSRAVIDGFSNYSRPSRENAVTRQLMLEQSIANFQFLSKNSNYKGIKPLYFGSESSADLQREEVSLAYVHDLVEQRPGGRIPMWKLIPLYLDILTRIGSKSAFGNAISADLLNHTDRLTNLFVVKVPGDLTETTIKEMSIEYCCGFFGINKVRQLIPNFMYTYAMFDCGKPLMIDSSEVVDYCNPSSPSAPYVVIERITDSVDARDFFKSCTAEEVMIVYQQVTLAIAMASEMVGFTHYDLHDQNVLIKRLSRPATIEYSVRGKKYFVTSNLVAVIIDYGHSRIELNGRIISSSYNYVNPMDGKYNHPMFDFYRFFMTSSDHLRRRPDFDMSVNRQIYRYFDASEDLNTALNAQFNSYYLLPYNGKYNIQQFYESNLANKRIDLPRTTPYPLYSEKFLDNHIASQTQITISDSLQFYEAVIGNVPVQLDYEGASIINANSMREIILLNQRLGQINFERVTVTRADSLGAFFRKSLRYHSLQQQLQTRSDLLKLFYSRLGSQFEAIKQQGIAELDSITNEHRVRFDPIRKYHNQCVSWLSSMTPKSGKQKMELKEMFSNVPQLREI